MNEVGKFLVIGGLILAGIGVLLWLGAGRSWLGKLPGDIYISRGNFSVYFPIVTGLLISALLALVFWLFRK